MITDISVTQDKVLMDTYKHIDLPVGTIIMNAGNNGSTSFGDAFLLCNGASVSDASYNELSIVIGTIYGTIGAGFFNLPNFVDRFPMGLPSVGATRLVADDPSKNTTTRQGGNLVIQSNQFVHRHLSSSPGITAITSLNTRGDMDDDSISGTFNVYNQSTSIGNQTITLSPPLNNLPPYYTLNYFIYTGKGVIG
jgi:microcystin-dependent protein